MPALLNWRVIYTRPGWEKKVADQLTAKNLENYCPVNRIFRPWTDRRKMTSVPLIDCYVFVKLDGRDPSLVRSIPGVINLVHWLNKPAIIKDEEITLLKHFLEEYDNVQLERVTVQNRIAAAPMDGVLVLPSLGYRMTAEVDAYHVEYL